MEYEVKNLHSIPRSYPSSHNGAMIEFAPGEQKTVKTSPPRSQSLWLVEAVEETEKPEDIETKKEGGEQ